MANKTLPIIEKAENDFAILQERLETARRDRDEYNRQLKNARERLKRREETEYPTKLAKAYVEGLKKGNILFAMMVAAIDKAAEINGEFRSEAYKKALYEAASDASIYKISIMGSGWSTRIVPVIVFEESAGSLADWAEAVDSYRLEIKTKGLNNEQAGEKASAWWHENVFSTGLETKTFLGRMAYATGKAPFWQILAYGTVPLGSDRPGGYTEVKATRTDDTVFVDNVEWAVKDEFNSMLAKERDRFYEEEQELKKLISEYERRRDEYSSLVESLKTEMRLNEKVFRQFEENQQYIDKNILARAINSIDDRRRKSVETINIAKKGSGLDLLITIRRTEGVIEY